MHPRTLVSGVGTNDMPVGWIAQSKLNNRIYDLWKAMLDRTTEKFQEKYPTYINTTVAEEWKTLSNFASDIKELPGYNEWLESYGKMMMLDKDTLVEGNKHYSKSTCQFISHADSNRDVARRHPENIEKAKLAQIEANSIPVCVTKKKDPDFSPQFFPSLKSACREYGLNTSNAWMVINDKYPSNKSVSGYIITKVEKQNKNSAGTAIPAEQLSTLAATIVDG